VPDGTRHPAPSTAAHSGSVITIDVRAVASGDTDAVVDLSWRSFELGPSRTGRTNGAVLITEPAPNNFPALPIREAENVVVRVARHLDLSRARELEAELDRIAPALHLRLAPTPGSWLR
jgi:hypothetical protein